MCLLAHFEVYTRLKSSVASKWASKNHWGVPFILLLMVNEIKVSFKITLKILFVEIIHISDTRVANVAGCDTR